MGVENIDSYQELKKLDEQIESATELAALKPIYFRLNEIIQAFPGDFDVQFTGNEVKQRLMARGTLLKQQGISPSPPAPPQPAMPETQPPPLPTPFPETVAAAPVAEPEPLEPVASPAPPEPPAPRESSVMITAAPSPSFPLFPLFAGAPAQPEPPAPPAYFADTVGPAPAASPAAPVMPGATLLALSYPLHGSASPEQPPLALGVTPAEPPPAPPPPAMPAAQPAPPPISVPDIVPSAPAASPASPAPAPFPLPSPLFDFTPPEPPPPPFAVTPENLPQPPAPPVAKPAAQPPPLPLSSPLFDSAPPPAPPHALPATPEKPPQPPTRPPASPRRPFNWKRPVVIAPIAGVLVALIIIFFVVHQTRTRNAINAARNRAVVQVDIATTPPGASVRAVAEKPAAGGNESTCTSNCKLALTPGTYQISASLDGFEPAAGAVAVRALKPVSISLTLQPQALSVRLLTDLVQGKVVVDDRPPVDLQEGQLVLDKMAPGTHTVKVTGPNGDASFSFEMANARLPAVTGPVNARNMVAVLVASFGKQARIVTNAGPWKLAVNGQPQGDAGPAGTDLTGFQPGVNEVVVGEGKDQRNMSESFGAAPMLTAFLKTDVNAGTLIVSTSQDGVRVFLNGKEYRRLTSNGQLRLPILGKVSVRVAKSGFQDEPEQTVDVKKGAEVRLQFNLRPQPQFGSLQIHGAMAGTEVLVDQKIAGTVGPDGLFNISEIQPGDHTIELRRDQRLPKRLQRSFQAGQTVVLTGADAVLASANGTIRIAARNPASATVTYRRGDETEAHEFRGSQIELPAGTYVFSATAPGFNASTTRVQLAAGENREVDFNLAREQAAPPPVVANAMALFEDAQSWTKDGDNWVHKGGGFVPFKPPPKGILTFNVELVKGGGVFRAGAIRWCLQYLDSKNYLLFEIDRKNFRAWVIKNGQRLERVPKTPHNLGNQKTFTIQIEVTPDRLVQKVRGGEEWKALDTFAEPGRDFTQGKFGFLIQGNDEIAISDFKFQPR
ncbi:MAG: PEGA domain-containing protein [Bryobacteraceae bacterium]